MITFKTKVLDKIVNGKETTKTIEFKAVSKMLLKQKIEKVMSDEIVLEWEMEKRLPKVDKLGSLVEWTAGNRGLNASAYLFEFIEEDL